MGKTPIGSSSNSVMLPRWFITLCKWTWLGMSRSFFVIITAIALNILATFLAMPSVKLDNTVLEWFIQHAVLMVFLSIGLVLITILAGLVSRYPIVHKEKEVEQLYLKFIELYVRQLANIDVLGESTNADMQLDKMFVNLRFWPDQALREGTQDSFKEPDTSFLPLKLVKSRLPATTRNHGYIFPEKSVGFTDLWQGMTPKHPAGVILGAPGTGKSTLLLRLALNMAREGQGQSDAQWSEDVKPWLIPIYVRLRDYADECAKYTDAHLSLASYLKLTADRGYIPNLASFFEKSLVSGKCLLMFDGLDEVYDLKMRGRVEEAISAFVNEKCISITEETNFNRLLITSRITGYNLKAFPGYRHYTLAELGNAQILDFVQKWLRVNMSREETIESISRNEETQTVIGQMTKDIIHLFENDRYFTSSMKTPLCLAILTKMRWKGSVLPRSRVEVYRSIVRTFSEGRPTTSRTQILYLLEALAFQMQEDESTQISLSALEEVLKQELSRTNKLPNLEEESIKNFTREIQEQMGIFIEQGPNNFGFLHHTFQDYMAALYILNKTENDESWRVKIIGKVRHKNALWREPFLLAIASQSRENVSAARRMIETLLDLPRDNGSEYQLQDLILATECLIEAEPLAIGRATEGRIAEELLHIYIQAKHQQCSEDTSQIENIMRRWLNNLPEGKYRPALLTVLYKAIKDDLHQERQELALSLLNRAGWTEGRLHIAIQEDEYTAAE